MNPLCPIGPPIVPPYGTWKRKLSRCSASRSRTAAIAPLSPPIGRAAGGGAGPPLPIGRLRAEGGGDSVRKGTVGVAHGDGVASGGVLRQFRRRSCVAVSGVGSGGGTSGGPIATL